MKKLILGTVLAMSLVLANDNFEATDNEKIVGLEQSQSGVSIRPHFGFGSDGSTHYGARVLLDSSASQAYGLEVTKFKTTNDEFTAIGIVLEQKLWGWLNTSIGTVGYFNYGANNENAIGLMSNLGWEPDDDTPFRPFVTYRNDTIFGKDATKILHSISLGYKFKFEF